MWSTVDGFVPWVAFWVLYGDLRHIEAFRAVSETRAIGQAIGLAIKGDDPKVKSAFVGMIAEALGIETIEEPSNLVDVHGRPL